MSDGVEVVLRAAGGLIALGGLVLLYLLAAERFAERLLAAFGATRERYVTIRRLALSGIALLAFSSGLALAVLHRSAPLLMLVTAVVQMLWRLALRRWLPEGDAAAVNGREAARLVLMLHLTATAVVLAVDWRLPEIWRAGNEIWLAVTVGAVALLAVFGQLLGARRDGDVTSRSGDDGRD